MGNTIGSAAGSQDPRQQEAAGAGAGGARSVGPAGCLGLGTAAP